MKLVITAVTSSSVGLQWRQLPNLPQNIPDLGQYYGYRVFYRANYSSTFTAYIDRIHNAQSTDLTLVVSGLRYNHQYIFKMDPYREWEGVIGYGRSYPLATATTPCKGKLSSYMDHDVCILFIAILQTFSVAAPGFYLSTHDEFLVIASINFTYSELTLFRAR